MVVNELGTTVVNDGAALAEFQARGRIRPGLWSRGAGPKLAGSASARSWRGEGVSTERVFPSSSGGDPLHRSRWRGDVPTAAEGPPEAGGGFARTGGGDRRLARRSGVSEVRGDGRWRGRSSSFGLAGPEMARAWGDRAVQRRTPAQPPWGHQRVRTGRSSRRSTQRRSTQRR
ncbi:proline-rich receptor-like protein kinase PERK2 [Iris pallida]|uniref:Proline-rich receptor-like protein kinase PERK2 n=1 Tax=Iris pallida TaxID=29817 RepID=A0AAX6IKA3_IRIPA|nr:proline-rich receptor-like protein kinase PERK2 [Iris pallida]